jgi:hypothetical protein
LSHTVSIAYAAGFFDGEGSISAFAWRNKAGYTVPYIRLSVTNMDKTPLALMHRRWNGSLSCTKGEIWSVNWNGADAYHFLKDVIPYLITKQQTALAARDFCEADTPVTKLLYAIRVMMLTRMGYRADRSTKTVDSFYAELERTWKLDRAKVDEWVQEVLT